MAPKKRANKAIQNHYALDVNKLKQRPVNTFVLCKNIYIKKKTFLNRSKNFALDMQTSCDYVLTLIIGNNRIIRAHVN